MRNSAGEHLVELMRVIFFPGPDNLVTPRSLSRDSFDSSPLRNRDGSREYNANRVFDDVRIRSGWP